MKRRNRKQGGRNYKAEYRRRIKRGLSQGLSRSQARGHPKAKEFHLVANHAMTLADHQFQIALRNLTGRQERSCHRAQSRPVPRTVSSAARREWRHREARTQMAGKRGCAARDVAVEQRPENQNHRTRSCDGRSDRPLFERRLAAAAGTTSPTTWSRSSARRSLTVPARSIPSRPTRTRSTSCRTRERRRSNRSTGSSSLDPQGDSHEQRKRSGGERTAECGQVCVLLLAPMMSTGAGSRVSENERRAYRSVGNVSQRCTVPIRTRQPTPARL